MKFPFLIVASFISLMMSSCLGHDLILIGKEDDKKEDVPPITPLPSPKKPEVPEKPITPVHVDKKETAAPVVTKHPVTKDYAYDDGFCRATITQDFEWQEPSPQEPLSNKLLQFKKGVSMLVTGEEGAAKLSGTADDGVPYSIKVDPMYYSDSCLVNGKKEFKIIPEGLLVPLKLYSDIELTQLFCTVPVNYWKPNPEVYKLDIAGDWAFNSSDILYGIKSNQADTGGTCPLGDSKLLFYYAIDDVVKLRLIQNN